MVSRTSTSPDYYIRNSIINVEEDNRYEFKGHRTISQEELQLSLLDPITGRGTRQPISRNLCAFLNTGKGGIVYLGVIDNGQILGIPRTVYQMDHLRLSIQDTLSRFTPPVPPELYEMRFVPVIDKGEVEIFDLSRYTNPVFDSVLRRQPHKLRHSHYCWCDSDSQARFINGVIPDQFVVEIEIFPWDPENLELQSIAVSEDVPIHPLFLTETGSCFVRGQGGVLQMMPREIAQYSTDQVRSYYKDKIAQLNKKIANLKKSS